MKENTIIVNSWNEWDSLKHVIVGRADNCCIPPSEPATDPKIPEDSDMKGMHGPRSQESIDKGNAQLDGLASILEKRGIKVDRPIPLDFNQKISTPDWEIGSMFGCMPPRDVILTLGKEMLEATMSYRSRWFEYLCYRPLLKDYYNNLIYSPISDASGYSSILLNGNEFQRKGIELTLDATPIKNENFIVFF